MPSDAVERDDEPGTMDVLIEDKSGRASIRASLPPAQAVYVYMQVMDTWRTAHELIKDTKLMQEQLARYVSKRSSERAASTGPTEEQRQQRAVQQILERSRERGWSNQGKGKGEAKGKGEGE